MRLIVTPSGKATLIDDGATICGTDGSGVPLGGGKFHGDATFDLTAGTMTVDYTKNLCFGGTDPGDFPGIVYSFVGTTLVGGDGIFPE